MITAICGHEANAGRTTMAINLAVMLACTGTDVLVIDASANQDASEIYRKRSKDGTVDAGFYCHSAPVPETLFLAINRLASRFSNVIIDADVKTSLTAACRSDHVLVMAGPNWDEEDRDGSMWEAAFGLNNAVSFYQVFNRPFPNFDWRFWIGPSNGKIYKLTNRWAMAVCIMSGVSVTEIVDPKDLDPIASNEILKLFNAIYGPFEPKPHKKIFVSVPPIKMEHFPWG